MIRTTLAAAAQDMQGVLRGADAAFSRVGTDSRVTLEAALFFALRGEHHDGHDHVAAARAAGAVAVVVSRDDPAFGEPRIVVADTLQALGRLAAAHRLRMPARVVAITGNSGKTTTRELTAAVLRRQGATLATRSNFNNEIGTPLTLLELGENDSYAVVELGQGRPGDIAYLVDLVRPDVALVTNVTGAHLAAFGTLEAIADGKGEVYSRLAPGGVAIINADDRFAARWQAALPPCRRLTFGMQAAADVRAEDVTFDEQGCARFVLVAGGARTPVALSVPGAHNVSNALAAASVGVACRVPPAEIAAGLAGVLPVGGRLAVRHLADGTRLVDDTYNANPGSVRAAIRTLCGWPGERLLVLGHMAELGPTAAQLHREIGAYARECGVDALYTTGDHAAQTAAGFGEGAQAFADIDQLLAALRARLAAGSRDRATTILVKGSRSARMERVVAALTGEKDAAVAH